MTSERGRRRSFARSAGSRAHEATCTTPERSRRSSHGASSTATLSAATAHPSAVSTANRPSGAKPGAFAASLRAARSEQRSGEVSQKQSEALRGTQRHSLALRDTHSHSFALISNQRHSEALRGNQWQSIAISGKPTCE